METIGWIGTLLFGVAVLHTFTVKEFRQLSSQYPPGSIRENLFHFLGEIEVVFGLWAGVLFLIMVFMIGLEPTKNYFDSQNYTEPLFVFAIMTVAATKPVMVLASKLISILSRFLPFGPPVMREYILILTVGPILGSFITEPAAMTVTALLLKRLIFDQQVSEKFKYVTLGLLFVSISIGGLLTHFAAPPVLMVASAWHWDTLFMLKNFGFKAAGCVLVSAVVTAILFSHELEKLTSTQDKTDVDVPLWISLVHVMALIVLVFIGHYRALTIGFLLFFIGFAKVTERHQSPLRLRESLLVGFFLAGLVIFGSFQRWWLEPLISNMDNFSMFVGSMGLTAITDNAALTYLGTQVPNLSEPLRYTLVSGAVIGGGLTVIANAPNPAGFQILSSSFSKGGISPVKLFLAALPYTIFTGIVFWISILDRYGS